MSRKATLALASRIADVTGAGAELLAALDVCLGVLDRSAWPDVGWGFSRLTSTGYPVEFGFSTAADELRATVEVAGPETPEHRRLDAALELVALLGLPAPDRDRVRAWRALQADAHLRWGCWLSLRQTPRGFGAKVYIETPRGAAAKAAPACPGARLHMLGYDLESGENEHYFIWPQVSALECELRLGALGVGEAAALLTALESVIGLPRASGICNSRLGVSLADRGRGAAVFLDSGSVIGGAAAIRRRLARPGSSYDVLLSARSAHELPDHGVLTLIPRASGMELRASIAADALA